MRRLVLALMLMLWPTVAAAEWREASSRHFLIYSQQSEADLRKLADNLERLDKALRVQLMKPDDPKLPVSRLTVYVLKDQEALGTFLKNRNVAGVYMPRHSGSIAFTHEGRRNHDRGQRQMDPRLVLFHEYTHHFMRSNFSFGAPLWFSEGYAEFWSTATFPDDGSVNFGMPGSHRALELTELRNVPVPKLVTLRHPIPDQETYSAIYGRGWVLSHYLSFEPTRKGHLNAYLRALADGRSAEEAAKAFGDLNKLEGEIRQYVGRKEHPYMTLRADQVKPGPISIRVLRPGEQDILPLRMRSKRGVDEREAKHIVGSIRQVAQRHPMDPIVQVTLAEAEYDAQNYNEAEAAAARAMELDPKLVDAHLYRARALWARLAKAKSTDAAQWKEVQRRIAVANQIDPTDPEPLYAFYQSFKAAGTEPTRNAIEGLLDAQSLAREDHELRLAAARHLLIAKNARGARAMLGPLAADTHSGSLGTRIAEVLATLETGDTAQALARLEAALAPRGRKAEQD